MKLGFNARYAHKNDFAMTLYCSQLIQGLSGLLTNQDRMYVYRNAETLSPTQLKNIIPVHSHLPIHRQSIGLAWEQTYLPTHFLNKKIDIFHSPFFFLPLLRLSHKTKLVVTIQDLAFERNPEHFTLRSMAYFKLIARKSAKIADAIITASLSVKNDLVEIYKIRPDKITVIPYGINPVFNANEPIHDLTHLGINHPYILVVGVIHPRKNLIPIVESFSKIRDKFPSHQLVFLGRKALRANEVEAAVTQHGIENQTLFISDVSLDLMPSIYKNARCFIASSYSEGFGFPALEAMASNTPVIAANRGSLPEILGKYATYFDPIDGTPTLTEVLEKTLATPPALLEDIRKNQLALFDWTKMNQNTFALFKTLA